MRNSGIGLSEAKITIPLASSTMFRDYTGTGASFVARVRLLNS